MDTCISAQWLAPKLTSGLGNRFFQLAAAKTAADLWNLPVVFLESEINRNDHGPPDNIVKLFPEVPVVSSGTPLVVFRHSGKSAFDYVPFPQGPIADRILLQGHWIAANYVPKDFKPNWSGVIQDLSGLLAEWKLDTPEKTRATAFLHVRLGDYRVLKHHQVELLSYYAKALTNFPASTRVLVFSDEPDLARRFPVFDERCVIVREPNECKALFLMSNCLAGAICANSTFSWWGAYFAHQRCEGHKAYMPSRFMASGENTTDVYPTWATVLEV